jgi:hypothetical protein
MNRPDFVRPAYQTNRGSMYCGDMLEVLQRGPLTDFKGKVQLILTSPTFPLNRKKKYGNLTGEQYLEWLKMIVPICVEYLKPERAIVLELGNSWERGRPTMSTLP